MIKTFKSKYIPLSAIENCQVLLDDMHRYNSLKRKFVPLYMSKNATVENVSISQEVKKAGGGKRLPAGKSLHTTIKDEENISDYHVTAIESSIKQTVKSSTGCLNNHIETLESRIEQMDNKIDSLNHKLNNFLVVKESLKARSKARKEKIEVPKFKGYPGHPFKFKDLDNRTEVRIESNLKKGVVIFDNEYLFEVQYVDTNIKSLKRRIAQITDRKFKAKTKVESLKKKLTEGKIPYCFVSKDYMRKLYTADIPHDIWKKNLCLKRDAYMTIPGRHDAANGNFVCRYNPDEHLLTYGSMDRSGRTFAVQIKVPGVIFKYGAEEIKSAVNAVKENRKPVTWTIHRSKNKIQILCSITLPDPETPTERYNYGCIGIDRNADNISVAETDTKGNLLYRKVLRFDLKGKSTAERKRILSETLDSVFERCAKTKKPLVYEDIDKIKKSEMYSNKKRNRIVSQFAYNITENLIISKAVKNNVPISTVNPAFTSQIGKIKYMKTNGLSIHEAAAYTIARRFQKFDEKIPHEILKLVPDNTKQKSNWAQWSYVSRQFKRIPVYAFQKGINYPKYKSLKEIAKEYSYKTA